MAQRHRRKTWRDQKSSLHPSSVPSIKNSGLFHVKCHLGWHKFGVRLHVGNIVMDIFEHVRSVQIFCLSQFLVIRDHLESQLCPHSLGSGNKLVNHLLCMNRSSAESESFFSLSNCRIVDWLHVDLVLVK